MKKNFILWILSMIILCLTLLFFIFSMCYMLFSGRDDYSVDKQEDFNSRMIESITNQKNFAFVLDMNIDYLDIQTYTYNFHCSYPQFSFCVDEYDPELFDRKLLRVNIIYDDASTINKRIEEIENEVKAIASNIDPEWTDIQKVEWINNYICYNINYDFDFTQKSVYDAITSGNATCGGISGVFQLLADECGLNASYCYDFSKNHVWNIVEVDGKWYHIDASANTAYDDPSMIFLKSDAWMLNNVKDIHIDLQEYKCTEDYTHTSSLIED